MSLPAVESIDLFTYLDVAAFDNDALAQEVNNQMPEQVICYLQALDNIYTNAAGNAVLEGVVMDAALISQGGVYVNHARLEGYIPGQYDRTTAQQRLYAYEPSKKVSRRDPLNPPNVITADPFPLFRWDISTVGPLVDGHYDEFGSNWQFFDLGYGKAMMALGDIRLAGVTWPKVCAIIDLATGLAESIFPTENFHAAIPAHEFQGGLLFGDLAEYHGAQFIPDQNSTELAPKGEIFFWTGLFADGANHAQYVKWVDFNPLGATGNPVRINGRTRLETRLVVVRNDFGGATNGIHASTLGQTFHRPADRSVYYPTAATAVTYPVSALEGGFVRFLDQPVIAFLTNPSPQTDVATNSIVEYLIEARGDLSEPIAGVRLDITLQAASTAGEILATTPTPGETVIVANFPIDALPQARTVFEDAVALTEGVHFTITEATGSVNFIGPKPLAGGEVYTIDYAHEAAPVSPPWGRLLADRISADRDGNARARVEYVDSAAIEFQRDTVTATTV